MRADGGHISISIHTNEAWKPLGHLIDAIAKLDVTCRNRSDHLVPPRQNAVCEPARSRFNTNRPWGLREQLPSIRVRQPCSL
jgi:hypothetical protein